MANEALALAEKASAPRPKNDESGPTTLTQRILKDDPINLGRAYLLVGTIEVASGVIASSVSHLNIALKIFEEYDYQREISIVSNILEMFILEKLSMILLKQFLIRPLR